MTKPTNYYFSADLIRAVAIILVVLIHVFSEFLNYPKVLGSIDWWIADTINAGARIAVPLFVMLSGMLILHSEKTYTIKEFLKKRVSKIGIPLVAWSVIYLLWKVWFGHAHFSLLSIIKDFINLNIYYHLYYVYIIAALYLLTPLLKIIINNATHEIKTYFFLLTTLFSLLLTATIYFFSININLSTIYTIFIPYLAYYLAGDYLRNKRLTKKEMYLYLLSFLVLMLITAFGTRWHMSYLQAVKEGKHVIDFGKYFYDYTSITVFLMSIIAFVTLHNLPIKKPSLQQTKLTPMIKSLASTSFGIYLIHPLLLAMSNRYISSGFTEQLIPLWIFVVVKITALVGTSYLLIWIIRKIPLLKLIV